jgi:3-oxoacyl-[acyl-carrier-protein] synthase-3
MGVAADVEVVEDDDGHGIIASAIHTDADLADITRSLGDGFYPGSKTDINEAWMNGPEVFKYAASNIPLVVEEALDKAGLGVEDVNLFVPHQANTRILEPAAKRLGDHLERWFINIQKYGNTSSASLLCALHEAFMGERIRRGDIIVLVGVGGGMTIGAIVLRW